MIKKLNTIKSLSVFRDFSWDEHVVTNGSPDAFKQINVIFGRNYSGKTTLSRIVRSMETGTLSSNYTSPQFSVLWYDNSETTNNALQAHGKPIRVFNEDFVRENLSFLMDTSGQNGEVKPFAVIGADNVKIEGKIREIEAELGSNAEENETGLFAQLKMRKSEEEVAITNHRNAQTSLQNKKTAKATGRPNGIKYRSDIFGDQNYNITKLESDINTVLSDSYVDIDDKKRQELEASLHEEPKANIPPLSMVAFLFQSLSEKVKELVERKIGGSEKIQELVRDYALNEWVKHGCELHKDKSATCFFCGGAITDDRWTVLQKHFDEETGRIEKDIDRVSKEIRAHRDAISNGFNISKGAFYAKFQSDVDILVNEYQTAVAHYNASLDEISQQLEKRKLAHAIDFKFSATTDFSSTIKDCYAKYETVRIQSNGHTTLLASAKHEAQKALRLHEVRSFVDDVDYSAEQVKIAELETKKCDASTATQIIKRQTIAKQSEIDNLKCELNDEEQGAVMVNDYLNHFFGHQSLMLQAIADESTGAKQIRFEIMRGDQRAFDLSEGECSLIAFCYFMAKLNDVEMNGKQPIIWIDDPISSLDGNHIFFVYSLLRAEIVEKKDFTQLFISTHSLEFLKYLKRLNGKDQQGKDYQKAWFIVERKNDSSAIKMMPKYLKEYITEFNYLFHQIFKCANAQLTDDNNYSDFYSFGNNARKFLEIYLYYKYPDGTPENTAHDVRIKSLFGDNVCAFLSTRLTNEQSHLAGAFERGAMPVDIPETQKVAKQICQKIEECDKKQYDALLRSIGAEIPVPSSSLLSEAQP